IIPDVQLIYLESVDCFHYRRGSSPLKPGRSTPTVLIGNRDEAVFDCVLMHVVQSSEIRSLVSEPGVPEIKPHMPAYCVIEPVQLASCVSVEVFEQFPEGRRSLAVLGRQSDSGLRRLPRLPVAIRSGVTKRGICSPASLGPQAP